MALLNILQFPDPRLKRTAEFVDTFDYELYRLVDDMFETMYEAQGVGLAATQVNRLQRVIVVDASETRNEPYCIINPEIISSKGSIESDEGCLSFPGVFAKVKRAAEIELKYYNKVGQIQTLSATGLLGICIQHEMDHLKGITFYDHLSPVKQTLLRTKLDKLRRKAL